MIFIDFETRSEISVKVAGSTHYARHPSTYPLCMAVARDDEPPEIVTDFKPPFDLASDWVVAHNAGFEKSIIKYCLPHWPQPKKWIDTSALCRLAGLPGSLGEAASILNIKDQKDSRGKNLVEKLCKPRKPTKKDPRIWNDDLDLFRELYEYCMQDVETMRALYKALPKMSRSEFGIWSINRAMNERGLKIDREALEAATVLAENEKRRAIEDLSSITDGIIKSPNQTKLIADYCGIPNATAKGIAENIDAVEDPIAHRVLEIRQELGKSSVSKLATISARIGDDDRIRDLLVYHGALTGRETGSGPQPLNWPRGKIKSAEEMENTIGAIICRDTEYLTDNYKTVLNAISYSLRGLIIPESLFLCADLNAIEARLVFWFAGEEKALDLFREYDETGEVEREIYRIQAGLIYHKDVSDINDTERFTGKTSILGLGYGMGAAKFDTTCEGYGVTLPDGLAQRAVDTYRRNYQRVVRLWYALERAAKHAIASGAEVRCGRVAYSMEQRGHNKWLTVRLPSGRPLRYFDPRIDAQGSIVFRGVEKGKFISIHTYGGKLLENIVQSTSRDLLWDIVQRLIAKRYKPVLTVYDEILCEQQNGSLDEMIAEMRQPVEWLRGLPLNANGWKGTRYRKA